MEVDRCGRDSFGEVDYLCVYGFWRPTVAGEAAIVGTVVLDAFAGSGNTLLWLARRLKPRIAVGFELDETVAAVTQRNAALLDLPIDMRPEPYERGIREMQVDEAGNRVVSEGAVLGQAARCSDRQQRLMHRKARRAERPKTHARSVV